MLPFSKGDWMDFLLEILGAVRDIVNTIKMIMEIKKLNRKD
jgi:hypothetical protein